MFELSPEESQSVSEITIYDGDKPKMHLTARDDEHYGHLLITTIFGSRAGYDSDNEDREFGCSYDFHVKSRNKELGTITISGNLNDALHTCAGTDKLFNKSVIERIKKSDANPAIYASTYKPSESVRQAQHIAYEKELERERRQAEKAEETTYNVPEKIEVSPTLEAEQTNQDILSQQQLFKLPETLTSTSTELNLNNQQLMFFPEVLLKFNNLEILNLSSNYIPQIPSEITLLNSLVELSLANNHSLYNLPNALCLLKTLRKLDLSNTLIAKLPDNIGALENLEELDLFNVSRLKAFPNSFGKLIALRKLVATRCDLQQLPNSFVQLKNLVEANFTDNALEFLPNNFHFLINLVSINLYCNRLRILPEDFHLLPKLEILFLVHNQLKALPDGIGLMPKLRIIDFDYNALSEIPDSLYGIWKQQLENQETLWRRKFELQHNAIEHLSENLQKLEAAQKLYLDHNCLSKLPNIFDKLHQLEKLNLASNLLTELPSSFSSLKNLRLLNLYKNKLTVVPDEICTMPTLETLNLEKNCITHLTFRMLLAILFLDKTILFDNNPLDQSDDLTRNMFIAFCYNTCGCKKETKQKAWNYCQYQFFEQTQADEHLSELTPDDVTYVKNKQDPVIHDNRCEYARTP